MTRSTNEISIEEVLSQLGRMAEDESGSGSSSSDAALNNLLTSIANNSTSSLSYGIPLNTGSRGPVDGSGLLTMSEAQANEITQQRIADRGLTDLSRLEDTTGIFAEIFGGMGRTDLLETGGELLQRISELAAEGRPIAPADLELATLSAEDAEAFLEAINIYNEGVVLGDPGQIDEDTTQSPVETVFEDDGTITTIIDPTLITLPPLLGDPVIEDVEGGGGATASPETEGTPQPTTSTPEAAIPDYSDLVNPEFEVPESPEGVTGIPEFYRVDEDGNVFVILDPNNPIPIPRDRVPDHVDTTTPGTYPESGGVLDEQEETTTPTISGPSIVVTPPASAPAPAPAPAPSTPSDVVTEEPESTETPSDTADTGTDQAGQEGQQGTDTGGVGGGSAGDGGDSTGNGTGNGDGGMLSRAAKAEDYFDGIGYQPVAVPNLILPNQSINTSIVPVKSRRDSFMDSSIVASMFKDLI